MTTSFSLLFTSPILQLGVRTFVTELTNSLPEVFQQAPQRVPSQALTVQLSTALVLQRSYPRLPHGCCWTVPWQSAALLLLKSPVIVIAGFVPLFFDNATIGVYANNKERPPRSSYHAFHLWSSQVFSSALIAGWVGMAARWIHGMWDWAVVWPIMTGIMKFLSYAGLAIVVIALIAIPQLQYRANKDVLHGG